MALKTHGKSMLQHIYKNKQEHGHILEHSKAWLGQVCDALSIRKRLEHGVKSLSMNFQTPAIAPSANLLVKCHAVLIQEFARGRKTARGRHRNHLQSRWVGTAHNDKRIPSSSRLVVTWRVIPCNCRVTRTVRREFQLRGTKHRHHETGCLLRSCG